MSKARDIADGKTSGGGGFKNLVINGAMNVHQRGGTTTTSGYLIDRFTFSLSGVGVTRSQDTDVPSGQGFSNSLKHLNTSTTTATSAYCASQTHIEAQDIRNSGWDYADPDSKITISFWAKSSIDGTYYMVLRTYDGTKQEYAAPYTLTANTWKRVDFQIAGNSNLTFDNDAGQGITIFPFIEMGSDYTDSAVMLEDQWVSYVGTAQTPDKQSSFMSTSGAAFWFTGVQMEVNDKVTDFEHRPYGDELARCERYLQRIGESTGAGTYSGMFNMNVWSSSNLYGAFNFPKMRAAPTATFSGTWTYYFGGHSGNGDPFASYITPTTIEPRVAKTHGATVGRGGWLRVNSGGYLELDAEL